MEYFVVRALEVARLTKEQLDIIHEAENRSAVGCLPPSGIQPALDLPTLKKTYGVPSGTKPRDKAAAEHWRLCTAQIVGSGALRGFVPPNRLLTEFHVENVHTFDRRIQNLIALGRLNFNFDVAPAPPQPERDPDQYRPRRGGTNRLLETDYRTAAGEGYAL